MSPSLDCKCTLKLNFSNLMSWLQPQWANHTSSLIACFAHCILSSPFYFLLSRAAACWAYLYQRHLWAESEQDFLGFGGVGVVSMLIEPLLQRPRHVLQSLTLVSHFPPAGTTPIGRKTSSENHISKEKKGVKKLHISVYVDCSNLLTAATKSAAAGV